MARQHPTVSIITPSLNSAAYLSRLVSCIDAQSYRGIEHIIVDGESTDQTAKILNKLDRSRHTIIVKKDRSMYQAINRGIKRSSGEIIGYLNTDDLYFPTTIETVVSYFATHPAAEIVFGDVVSLNPETHSFVLYVFNPRQYALSRIALNKSIGQPSVFLRREVFKKNGLFDDSLRFVADLEYWMRASKHRIAFKKLNKFLSIDVRRSGMLRDRHEQALHKELAQVRNRYSQFPGWQKTWFEKRNYWEDMFLDKFLEYNAGNRFLPAREQVLFDQPTYRYARKHKQKAQKPILTIALPYFSFKGTRLDGI